MCVSMLCSDESRAPQQDKASNSVIDLSSCHHSISVYSQRLAAVMLMHGLPDAGWDVMNRDAPAEACCTVAQQVTSAEVSGRVQACPLDRTAPSLSHRDHTLV